MLVNFILISYVKWYLPNYNVFSHYVEEENAGQVFGNSDLNKLEKNQLSAYSLLFTLNKADCSLSSKAPCDSKIR